MASSIYVYRSIAEYKKYYEGKHEQLIYQIPILDMYVDTDKEKMFVITNQDLDSQKRNIDFFRTIVHVRSETLVPSVISNDEFNVRVVQHGKVMYNGKSGNIEVDESKTRL